MKEKKQAIDHWTNNLIRELDDPSKWVLWNESIIVVKDRYPKATHHFLVMPRADIPSIFVLTPNHIGLLNRMYVLALQTIEIHALSSSSFQIGYHARPSLQQLHLHVISTDFNSKSLKTQKHWNSFNTELFIPHHDLIKRLAKLGRIERLEDSIYERLSNGTRLKCHICQTVKPTMIDLKRHILSHTIK